MKILRSVFMFLLLPLIVAAFYWEASFPMPRYGHAAAQILIVVIICGLALGLVEADEMDRLREIKGTYQARYHSDSESGEGWWSFQGNLPSQSVEVQGAGSQPGNPAVETLLDEAHPIWGDPSERGSESLLRR